MPYLHCIFRRLRASAAATATFVVLMFVSMMCLTGCDNRMTTAEVLGIDTLVWCDSISFGEKGSAVVRLNCLVPTKDSTDMADNIRKWILMEFENTELDCASDIREGLRAQGRRVLLEDSADITETLSYCTDELWPVRFERNMKIDWIYEDDEYLTMHCEFYAYLGGAHGTTYVDFATFRKNDGKLMGWELLPGWTTQQITDSIKRGLVSYFMADDEDDICEMLMLDLDNAEQLRIFNEDFPLPVTPPYLDEQGVNVIYQQYEITPYAASLPNCVVKRAAKK